MAETKIEWADFTFNPWTGCTKVSPGCDHCYAEGWSKRSGHVEWGPHGARRRTSPANWKLPLKWNAEAQACGIRRRVFCASLADVFDNHASILPEWRFDLWELIYRTPQLDWLLLTKRPQNINKYLPDGWLAFSQGKGWRNVWLGTTVENQTEADRRIPHLLAVPAAVRFLSVEPMLGPVDLSHWMGVHHSRDNNLSDPETRDAIVKMIQLARAQYRTEHGNHGLSWVICGGESGHGARPMHPDWARSLRDQCAASGVAFHFKQWGEWGPRPTYDEAKIGSVPRSSGGLARIGKKAAGRLLDGHEWNDMPVTQ